MPHVSSDSSRVVRSAASCGSSGTTGPPLAGPMRYRIWARSRFSKCPCSVTSAFLRSRSRPTRCTTGFAGASTGSRRARCYNSGRNEPKFPGGVPMNAIRVNAPGGPEVLRYEDVADPTPKAGEATVKVDAVGINYIDVYQRSGQYKLALPLTLGLEAGGTVTAVGPNAQYAVVPSARLVTLPSGLTTRQGAAAMLQGLTAHYLACSTYPLKPGDTCLVHAAAGGVGLLLCQIAKMRGARVIGTVSTDDKAKLAREAGASD